MAFAVPKIRKGKIMDKLRDPLPEEINTLEFNAVWDCIRYWDIGLPQDIGPEGCQLYSGATGNHVVAILDSLSGKEKSCKFHETRIWMNCGILNETCADCDDKECLLNKE